MNSERIGKSTALGQAESSVDSLSSAKSKPASRPSLAAAADVMDRGNAHRHNPIAHSPFAQSALAQAPDWRPLPAGSEPRGLRPSDFKHPMDIHRLRAIDDKVSHHAFIKDLAVSDHRKSAEKAADHFTRDFPELYWKDMEQIPREDVPAELGIVTGDPHGGNFGFKRIGNETVRGYIDLTQSGIAPVPYDAARFFFTSDWEFGHTKTLIEQYVSTVKDPDKAVSIANQLLPDWEKLAEHRLDKLTDGKALKTIKGMSPLKHKEREMIAAVIANTPELAGVSLLDAAQVQRIQGGTGGFQRYLLFIDRGQQKRDLIELNQAPEPGVNQLKLAEQLTMSNRLPILKQAFWGTVDAEDDFYTNISGKPFLARSILNMHGINFDKLTRGEHTQVMLANASFLANLHREAWDGVKKAEMTAWFKRTNETLVKRWQQAAQKISKKA